MLVMPDSALFHGAKHGMQAAHIMISAGDAGHPVFLPQYFIETLQDQVPVLTESDFFYPVPPAPVLPPSRRDCTG